MQRLLVVSAVLFMVANHPAAREDTVMDNVVQDSGGYVLAPGPNVEGVVLVRQGAWPPEVSRAFHEVGWLDAASTRLRWADLEPRDQEFNWGPMDAVLAEVQRYNAEHPGARRTLHIRVMGGVHCPEWFEAAGVRYYDTAQASHVYREDAPAFIRVTPLRIPMPYDNPEFLKQLREVYRAMYERYARQPLVTVYHGTWSAGPWDEIFHPQADRPLPPGYTPERFVAGMIQQLDVLIDEFCLKGKVAELPYSGKYPQRDEIDITGPLTARAVERLGRRSPYLYMQSNGWGSTSEGQLTVSWGHERDIADAYGQVNLAFQAIGTNAGGQWHRQGDWVELVKLAQAYEVAYVEIYPPDLTPLDTEHRIVQAFTQTQAGASGAAEAVPDFIGFRPGLERRGRTLYVREGTVRRSFQSGAAPLRVSRLMVAAAAPSGTFVRFRARTRLGGEGWSEWKDEADVAQLPPGTEADVEATLHTDDGYLTPRLIEMKPVWKADVASKAR